jgi:phosphatidylglycerol:prolipoprotein diacylglycerol transferase
MLVHPQFDPIAVSIGSFGIRWYGLMYLIGFVTALWLGRRRAARDAWRGWSPREMDDILFYGVLGVIIGGRLGYVFFYKPGYYLEHPLEIFYVWQGGMAFHGGFLGVLVAMLIFARMSNKTWLGVMDFLAPLVPPGLAAGRLGNFINAELWGRQTDVPWAMVFPSVDDLPRHPSQLYQFALEGVLLFVLLWWYSKKPRAAGAVSALFLLGYGVARFVVEYSREPDSFLGILALGFTMGQWLSLPMIVAGAWLLWWSGRRSADAVEAPAASAPRRK